MMRAVRALLVSLAAVALSSCGPAHEPLAVARLQRPVVQPASDRDEVRFQIRFADGKDRFAQGEVIRVELAFSSTVPNVYRLGAYRLDGNERAAPSFRPMSIKSKLDIMEPSGRLDHEVYLVEPPDAPDPFAEYFEPLADIDERRTKDSIALGDKAETVVFDLNEWRRFDRSGHHRLSVGSTRVRRSDGAYVAPIMSNVLDFDVVVPTTEVSARAVTRALELLARSEANPARDGARALRFMGTEVAAAEMIRRLARPSSFDGEYALGLIGSPHRAFILQTMIDRIHQVPPPPPLFNFVAGMLSEPEPR